MVKIIPHNWLFLAITDSNLGSVSLQIDPMASTMILGTSQGTQEVNKMVLGTILITNSDQRIDKVSQNWLSDPFFHYHRP